MQIRLLATNCSLVTTGKALVGKGNSQDNNSTALTEAVLVEKGSFISVKISPNKSVNMCLSLKSVRRSILYLKSTFKCIYVKMHQT